MIDRLFYNVCMKGVFVMTIIQPNFHSPAEEIKYYMKELFSDGQEHSRAEIIQYVKSKSNKKFSEGNYSGAIYELRGKCEIELVKRGVYRPNVPDPAFSSGSDLDERSIGILKNAISELDQAANEINVRTITESEQESIGRINKAIKTLNAAIDNFYANGESSYAIET